jgi:hypothetical protein
MKGSMMTFTTNLLRDPNFPDRLALTARDRRLESTILDELKSSGNGKGHDDVFAARGEGSGSELMPTGNGAGYNGSEPCFSPERGERAEDPVSREASRIFDHAVNLARFLVEEYGAGSPAQKRFIAEIGAEIAQRFAEEYRNLPAPPGSDKVTR